MQNLTGSAENWIPEVKELKAKQKAEAAKVVTALNIEEDITGLQDSYAKLNAKYADHPKKHIYDALMNIDLAIRAIQNIN